MQIFVLFEFMLLQNDFSIFLSNISGTLRKVSYKQEAGDDTELSLMIYDSSTRWFIVQSTKIKFRIQKSIMKLSYIGIYPLQN